VARARAHALAPEDVAGGTFTISNLGPLGVDAFTAVVNPPQAGILAVGRIADRVVAVDGVPAVQPTAILTLSLDHRVVDGAAGARFLESLARALGGAAISDPGSDRNLDTPGASR
jgi:pyruvate dehydrogenase E2 component (dihydrolipoamide acetyltransferase)